MWETLEALAMSLVHLRAWHWGLPLCNSHVAFLLAHSCQTSPSAPKACKSCLLYLENDGWTYLGIGI